MHNHHHRRPNPTKNSDTQRDDASMCWLFWSGYCHFRGLVAPTKTKIKRRNNCDWANQETLTRCHRWRCTARPVQDRGLAGLESILAELEVVQAREHGVHGCLE